MQKITTFLWFDNNAEEAVNFYCSLFDNSKILSKMPGPDGKILSLTFQLAGQQYIALNGGPMFKFTEAVSLLVNCDTQEEIDDKWGKLTADGGEESMCGWLKDKYGLSWQITPPQLLKMMSDSDREKAGRVMQAMMQMKKIDLRKLQAAYEGA
jgi:predicted 3-demethylubiquinone-9 3-methyltransferase (glyoxalase superfamily)